MEQALPDYAGEMIKLDKTDRQLLTLLQDDDRQSLPNWQRVLACPHLQRQGLIAGFHARISPEALGIESPRLHLCQLERPKGRVSLCEEDKGVIRRAGMPSRDRPLELPAQGAGWNDPRS